MSIPTKPIVIGVRAIIIKGNSVLLVQQTNKHGEIIYLLPGGGVHQDESLEEAVLREVEEETGLRVEPLDIAYIREMISYKNLTYEFIFTAEIKNGEPKLGFDPEQKGLEPKLKGLVFHPLSKLKALEGFYPESLRKKLFDDYKKGWDCRKVFADREVFDK